MTLSVWEKKKVVLAIFSLSDGFGNVFFSLIYFYFIIKGHMQLNRLCSHLILVLFSEGLVKHFLVVVRVNHCTELKWVLLLDIAP